MFVTTNRGLSLGSLSAARTTSALIMTRRWHGHLPAWYRTLSATPRELARSPHSAFGDALQHRILGHRHDILEFGLGVQKFQHSRMGEPAIQAYTNLYPRKMVTNHPHQAPQQGDRAHRCSHVARS